MQSNTWVDQLYDDAAITDGLAEDEAQIILSWAENHLSACENEGDARHLLDSVRLLSRYVKEGGIFDHLFAALKANTAPQPSNAPAPGDFDPGVETIYPTDS